MQAKHDGKLIKISIDVISANLINKVKTALMPSFAPAFA